MSQILLFYILVFLYAFYHFIIKKRFFQLINILVLDIIPILIYLFWMFVLIRTAVFNFIFNRYAVSWEIFFYYGMVVSTIYNLIITLGVRRIKDFLLNYKNIIVNILISIGYIVIFTIGAEIFYLR